ncbi:hypothetical protein N5C72_19075 [Achromobacter mucicolens]|uniref:Pilin accessory protein (PilO) n=1 Tax=Achromobacter mucicolens TaxID=1389922 RepID=A0ABD4YXJ0_9BURK|nr:hypothetical protein [Achromobacter mucicolens]MDG9971488.1 hypothetical protein [Achromobacter mucicolens]MDH1180192.1 hypothetical protein [Achromobacter mucicolens]
MARREKVPRRLSYRLVAIPGTSNQLVLGIRWQTILGEDLQKEALRLARKVKATHYVHSDARSPSLGLLTAKGKERRAKTRASLYSAASAFAQVHRHGTHIVALNLPDKSVWIAVIVAGVVQAGGDAVYIDGQAAQRAFEEALSRYGEAQVHGDYRTQSRPFSLQQLSAHANTQSALRRAGFSLAMVSPLWWAVLGLFLVYEAWDIGMSYWEERQARIAQEMLAAQPEVDPATLWTKAISAWAKTARTLGQTGLTPLLQQVEAVPTAPGRWKLIEVDCRPQARSCSAKYQRTRLADNRTLQAALPSAWTIDHLDLETANASWTVPKALASQPLVLADLPDANAMRQFWEPSWQALRPALQDLSLSPPGQVPITVPNIKLSNGLEQPVVKPKEIKLPATRALVINAPLRSLYGLALPRTTEVTQLQMRFTPDTTPGLATSAFVTTLKGTIYVESP